MTREMHDLQLLNDHQLSNIFDTLLNDLTIHIQQHTQRRIELVLYENTKLKLDRAVRRHESDKKLTKIISDALSNAELLWIAIQLDCDLCALLSGITSLFTCRSMHLALKKAMPGR